MVAEAVAKIDWVPVLHGPAVIQGGALGECVTHRGDCEILGSLVRVFKLSNGEVVFDANDTEKLLEGRK